MIRQTAGESGADILPGVPERAEESAESAAAGGELAVGVGGVVVMVAVFGTWIDDLFDGETFLSETRWRWVIAWFGLLVITEGLGERTQALWNSTMGGRRELSVTPYPHRSRLSLWC